MSRKRNHVGREAGVGVYLLVFLPAALAFLYVYLFGVNVVWRDQWIIVNHFVSYHEGTLNLSQFWAEHNEHIIIFPRLVMFGLGLLTAYDTRAEMYLILVCFLVTLIVFLRVSGARSRYALLLFVPVAFLVFSLRQYGNMLWGFQITFAFVQTFGVLAFYFLHVLAGNPRWRLAFPAAAASGVVASFSAVQGLLVWPVGLAQILLSPLGRTAKVRLGGLWGLLGAGLWAFYVLEQRSGHGVSPGESAYRPAAIAEFFLVLLGSSLSWPEGSVFAVGLLLAGLAAAGLWLCYRAGRLGEDSFWLALMFFALLTLASISLGRADGGLAQATISRYTTFSILAVVAIYMTLMKTALETPGRRSLAAPVLFGVAAVFVVSSIPNSYIRGIEAGSEGRALKERAVEILSDHESYPDEALEGAHGWENIRGRAAILERIGYSVFAGADATGTGDTGFGERSRGYPAYSGSWPAERISSRVIAFRSFSESVGSPTGHSIPISGSSQRIAPSARAL